jgi:hypothetical protein
MTRDDVQVWLDRYVEAWLTYDPDQVRDLFAEDVVYRYHPYDAAADVLDGREDVVQSWVAPEGSASGRDEPGTYDADYEPYAVDGQRAVATGWSKYWTDATRSTLDHVYDNVFLMEFDGEGRCRRFTEFFMERPKDHVTSGSLRVRGSSASPA